MSASKEVFWKLLEEEDFDRTFCIDGSKRLLHVKQQILAGLNESDANAFSWAVHDADGKALQVKGPTQLSALPCGKSTFVSLTLYHRRNLCDCNTWTKAASSSGRCCCSNRDPCG